MSEHTPGPWRKYEDGDFDISIIGSDNHHVCIIDYDHNETADADARLIALSPELLEALLEAHEIISCFVDTEGRKLTDEWDMICKVIDKAKGI